MHCLDHQFYLQADEAYLNGASRSPQLKAGADAARRALLWRERNSGMPIEEFFTPVSRLKESFAKLIQADEPDRVALVPAASYGIATVARNLPLSQGQHILVVEDQFPSNYYAWHRLCADAGAGLITVPRPSGSETWSQRVLEAITRDTAAVAIAQVHWSDGTLFDLEALRQRTDEVGAWLVIDGTQSVGAYPLDVTKVRPDALIAGGYKWLLGPYGCGYAYFGPRMDDGVPLEENWINRSGSEDFSKLAVYNHEYRPLAARYSVGEHSNFIGIPMQQAGLDLINTYGPESLQNYTADLWASVREDLENCGVRLPKDRPNHLVGLRPPAGATMDRLRQELEKRAVQVSYRGDLLRVSPSWYNRVEDMHRLVEALRAAAPTTRI